MPADFGNVCLLFGGAGPQPSCRGPRGSFPPGDCMEALCWSCCSLQHCLQFIVAYFCAKNALIYTFRGLLLWLWNDETFNVWKFWKRGGQSVIKQFSSGRVVSLLSYCPEHVVIKRLTYSVKNIRCTSISTYFTAGIWPIVEQALSTADYWLLWLCTPPTYKSFCEVGLIITTQKMDTFQGK